MPETIADFAQPAQFNDYSSYLPYQPIGRSANQVCIRLNLLRDGVPVYQMICRPLHTIASNHQASLAEFKERARGFIDIVTERMRNAGWTEIAGTVNLWVSPHTPCILNANQVLNIIEEKTKRVMGAPVLQGEGARRYTLINGQRVRIRVEMMEREEVDNG